MPSNTVGGDISRRVLLGALAGTALLGSTRVQGRQNLDENAGKKQYQGDRANTGYIPEECPPTANVRKEWEIDPDELRTTDMAIITTANVTYGFDESVYVVGKHRGAILDVDPESGSVGARWRADDFDGELTTPAAWNGVLYVGAGENDAGFEGTHGVVYAVDLYDEGTVWRSGVGRGPAYVTASNDLYVGSKGALYALDAREGSGLWTDVPDDADAQVGYPAVAGETVVYATDAGGVYALGEGGNRQWSADVGGGGTHVSVDDGVVYAGSADAPSVRALDLSGGSVRWETAIAGPVTHPPAVAGGRVYTFVRENGEEDGAGVLTALDAATGDRLWEFRTTSVYIGPRPPLVSRDAVLVVGNPKPYDNLNNAVYVVDAASGDRRARIDLRQDPGTSAPVVLEDTLYVADNSVGIGYLSAHVGDTRCGDPPSPPDGGDGGDGGSGDRHSLMIGANGPVDYTLRVDGSLEPDTDGGNYTADPGDEPTREGGLWTVSDSTGPAPEDAGGFTYLGDRYIFDGSVEDLSLAPASGVDVALYLDERRATRDEVARVSSGRHSLMVGANGPVDYTLRVDGSLEPDTDGGDFSADSGDEPTREGGLWTVDDSTGPTPEDAGGFTYLGDRYILAGSVEDLSLASAGGADVALYLDERRVSRAELLRSR